MSIGFRIKSAREAKKMTQEELGAACGTTKQSIFKYETGIVTNIPLDRLEKIAEILDVSPAFLMGWEDHIPVPERDPLSNIVKLAGRDGRYLERRLSDAQLNALMAMVEQLPDAEDL